MKMSWQIFWKLYSLFKNHMDDGQGSSLLSFLFTKRLISGFLHFRTKATLFTRVVHIHTYIHTSTYIHTYIHTYIMYQLIHTYAYHIHAYITCTAVCMYAYICTLYYTNITIIVQYSCTAVLVQLYR